MLSTRKCLAMMLACGSACFAQAMGGGMRGFQGPSILSRGFGTVGRGGSAPLSFTPYISASSYFRSGLTAAATDGNGQFLDQSDWGMQASLGAYLRHLGNHRTVSVDYRTHMRYHARRSYHFGNDHFLGVGYMQQVSPRISYFLRQSASTFSAGFGNGFNSVDGSIDNSLGFGFANQGFLLNDPLDQVFDSRIYGLSSTVGMVYQKSARLSMGMAGGYHMTRYHSNALVGSQGARASGNISYSLSERSVIGVHYGFARTRFRTAYGGIDSHQTGVHFGRSLSARWHFSMSGGIFRAEVNRLTTAALDPLAALLLGQSTQLLPFYSERYGFGGSATLGSSWERHSFGIHYGRGTTPGNGVVFGAQSERVGLNHSFIALRDLSLGSHLYYSQHKSMFNSTRFTSYGVGTGTTYRLFSIVGVSVRADYRHSELRGTSFSRRQLHVSGGLTLAYSPGAIPVSLW